MPYVERDSDRNIAGVSRNFQRERAEEFLTDDHPDMIALNAAPDIDAANNAILGQIEKKERDAIRSLRELMREQHFPGDLTPQAKAFAQNKVRSIDQEIEVLRGQLT